MAFVIVQVLLHSTMEIGVYVTQDPIVFLVAQNYQAEVPILVIVIVLVQHPQVNVHQPLQVLDIVPMLAQKVVAQNVIAIRRIFVQIHVQKLLAIAFVHCRVIAHLHVKMEVLVVIVNQAIFVQIYVQN